MYWTLLISGVIWTNIALQDQGSTCSASSYSHKCHGAFNGILRPVLGNEWHSSSQGVGLWLLVQCTLDISSCLFFYELTGELWGVFCEFMSSSFELGFSFLPFLPCSISCNIRPDILRLYFIDIVTYVCDIKYGLFLSQCPQWSHHSWAVTAIYGVYFALFWCILLLSHWIAACNIVLYLTAL